MGHYVESVPYHDPGEDVSGQLVQNSTVCDACGHDGNNRQYLRVQARWYCHLCAQEIGQVFLLWKDKLAIEHDEQSWNPT